MNILVMDDEQNLADLIRDSLNDNGYHAMSAYDGEHGLMLCIKHPFDLVIVDIFMPNKDGLEVILDMKKNYPDLKIIAISGMFDLTNSYLATAQAFGADATVSKPFTMPQLLDCIKRLFAN